MRSIVKLMLIGMLFIFSCQNRSEQTQAFIDGIYINHAEGEYAVADDTLTFTHTYTNHYIITRRNGYRAVRNGKLLKKKYRSEKMDGIYDPQNRLLNETTTGRIIRFDPARRQLRIRQAVYHKLN